MSESSNVSSLQDESILFRHMRRGFSSIRDQRAKNASQPVHLQQKPVRMTPPLLVHFMDPSSSSSALHSPSKNNASNNTEEKPSSESGSLFFDRWNAILETIYNSTLPHVTYHDLRSNAATPIPGGVPLRCKLVPFVQVSTETNSSAGAPSGADANGDNAAASAALKWHTQPASHIYVVSCTNAEDYRNKVRPSIHVFMSLLQDAQQKHTQVPLSFVNRLQRKTATAIASPAAMAASSTTPPPVPPCVLLYCPARPEGTVGLEAAEALGATTTSQRPVVAFANRIRQRMNATASTSSISDSGDWHGPEDGTIATMATTATGDDASTVASVASATTGPTGGGPYNPSQSLTKAEKDIFRRLQTDFPNATVTALTTLSAPLSPPSNSDDAMQQQQHTALMELIYLEWQVFLRALGQSVAQSFSLQCQMLQEALQQLSRSSVTAEHVGWYLLLKETMAFLYEQMSLPNQALLQYRELRAFLPELYQVDAQPSTDVLEGIDGLGRSKPPSRVEGVPRGLTLDDLLWSIWELEEQQYRAEILPTSNGDWRTRLWTLKTPEYPRWAGAVEEYLYGREITLLFQTGEAAEVVHASQSLVQRLFDWQDKASTAKDMALEQWAFAFGWDIQRAAETLVFGQPGNGRGSPLSRKNVLLVGRYLSETLAFSRMRMLEIAAIKFGTGDTHPLHRNPQGRKSFDALWEKVWEPGMGTTAESGTRDDENSDEEILALIDYNGKALIEQAVTTPDDFVSCYLAFMHIFVQADRLAGRHRIAARHAMEVVDLYVLRKSNLVKAIQILQSCTQVYAYNKWQACHFGVNFRLASLVRQVPTTKPLEYARTLLQCFGEANRAAPPKALQALYRDLHAAVAAMDDGEAAPETMVLVNPTMLSMNVTIPDATRKRLKSGTTRRLLRKVQNVGEKACVSARVQSYLPEAIEVQVVVEWVPYQVYVTAQEEEEKLELEDISHTVSRENVTLEPGMNSVILEWLPTFAGQFVLFRTVVRWSAIDMQYHSWDPVIRMDVLPSDSSQTLKMNPLFLVEGHEQPLQVELRSGKDWIETGELNLVCGRGLMLMPPDIGEGSQEWCSSCSIQVGDCPPNETRNWTLAVKCLTPDMLVGNGSIDSEEDDDAPSSPTVHARVQTIYRYHHSRDEGASDEAIVTITAEIDSEARNHMDLQQEHEMESIVPTLGHSILSIDHSNLHPYAVGRAMLSLAVVCHVPAPFILKNWRMEMPSYLEISQPNGEDPMNASLRGTSLKRGDLLHFGFPCTYSSVPEDISVPDMAILHCELEDGVLGTLFREKLSVRINRQTLPEIPLNEAWQRIPVRATFASDEAKVGVSVSLEYTIDTAKLQDWKGTLLYEIDTECIDWLVAGTSKGSVAFSEAQSTSLSITVVPTRPGKLVVPSLSLSLVGSGLRQPVMLSTVPEELPVFHATLSQKHTTIAFGDRYEI